MHAVIVPATASVADCKRLALVAAKSHGIAEKGDRVVSVQGARDMPSQPGIVVTMGHVL